MIATKQNRFRFPIADSWFFGLVIAFCGLIVNPAIGADSLYENDAVVADPEPIPDATNFVNNGSFSVSVPSEGLYQTRDTLNYTNNGFMHSVFGFNFNTFSTVTSENSEAASFNNQNTIEVGAQCLVWATNIVCPGYINVDDNLGFFGLESFTGNSVDLSFASLILGGGLGVGGVSVNSLDYGTGTDTNADWQPSVALTETNAQSSFFSSQLFPPPGFTQLTLGNSLSYFNFTPVPTNAEIIRAAFVQNLSSNATYNVYFGAVPVGSGFITIAWQGIYTNIATGQLLTNYLYLNDLPEPIITNGEKIVAGVPNNYTFTGSSAPLFNNITATPAGFTNVFNAGVVTDNYSYVEAQLIGTTVSTNLLANTNVSAIAGRVMINASQELNLNQALIGGENYINLTSTNQFDGTGGAAIPAAYADIDIGVTNGNLVVSNVFMPTVPCWSGTVQAWSTRWLNTISNTSVVVSNSMPISTNTFAFTNDYRVELVNADVFPTTPSQVQNLTLLASNSCVISDFFNIFGSLYINANSLTITTNGVGNGYYSELGGLNVQNSKIFWPTALPNLHWLTNNGVINLGNLSYFGTATPVYITNVIAGTPGVAPTNTLINVFNSVTNGLKAKNVTIGTNVYVFVNKLTNSRPDQVLIAPTLFGTMSNLVSAINRGSGKGTNYSTNTSPNVFVTAGKVTTSSPNNFAFTVTAVTPGTGEDSVATTTTATNLSWSGATLSGGTNTILPITNIIVQSGPYGAFVNNGSISDSGSQIYADYFENSGPFNNGENSFALYSTTVVLTNGYIYAYFPFPSSFTNGLNGNISITASTMIASNVILAAGGGINLLVTNMLSDTGVTNGSLWYLNGGSGLTGLNLPIKPTVGDLLGTTIELITPAPNKPVKNTWAGQDLNASVSGYVNNEAIGQLVLDVPTPGSSLSFNGVSNKNAMYVDRLELLNYASYANGEGTANIPTLNFNTNMVIYYADAVASSTTSGGPLMDVSYLLNHSNGNHLIWVPQYAGFFSSTNVVYAGATNTLNVGLLTSPFLDSNGNGIPNAFDPNPLFVPSQVNFKFSLTNIPPEMALLTWDSIPSSTNIILYTTNLSLPMSDWQVVTNFVSPSAVPPVGGWPITNVVVEPLHMTTPHGFYRVTVNPNNADVYGQ